MNKIFTHPGQPQMQVEVILASSGRNSAPTIYTIRMRYPRIIHGEIMTHRLFSRNARSSRAVPVRTMLLETTTIPFIPWHWGANQKGMQATQECDETVLIPDWDDIDFHGKPHLHPHEREQAWLSARDAAVVHATAFMDAGYHKQNVNRLLEPFSWIDTLITSTDWDNFLWLRDHKGAEPHLQDLARLVKAAIEAAEIQELDAGQWHLPYITNADRREAYNGPSQQISWNWLCRISAARCARISYAPFDGDASYEKELERYESLVESDRVHASPTEHQAQVDRRIGGDFEKWGLSGNLAPGWIQARKLIPNERHIA